MTIEISINGEQREIADGLDVSALLETLGIDGRKVAVERNLEIVPKSRYAETVLKPRDQLEIVQFVGGG